MRRIPLLAAAVLAASALTAPGSAAAAPSGCTASESEIFAPAAPLSGGNGELLACREVTLPHVPGNIPMKAYQVRYVSSDLRGKKVPVTGFVAVPTAAWKKSTHRPTVAFNPGTLGSGAFGPLAATAFELVALVFEEHVEGGQRSIAAGYVLLHFDLLGVGHLGVRVNLLLEHA